MDAEDAVSVVPRPEALQLDHASIPTCCFHFLGGPINKRGSVDNGLF
jgi:hypothetical protein